MAIEKGHAFAIIHLDTEDVTASPRVEIHGMSMYAAQNLFHVVAGALWNRLNGVDIAVVGPDGDTLIVEAVMDPDDKPE